MKKVAIVTTKQPGTNPRMKKSADALSHAGYDVYVLYAFNTFWADEADEITFQYSQWNRVRIGGHPVEQPLQYLLTRIRKKFGQKIGAWEWYLCPRRPAYIGELRRIKPDLVIGHNPGTLPILKEWKDSNSNKVIFDAEDFHRGESYWVQVQQEHIITDLENKYLQDLPAVTAASPLICDAYRRIYPCLKVITVNNAFPKNLLQLKPKKIAGPLRLVWFSQHLGLERGLKEFIAGMSHIPELPIQLTLIGIRTQNIEATMRSYIVSNNHSIRFLNPMPEKKLLNELAQHEIGLALELSFPLSKDICRANKLYTYPLAGCFMLVSKTSGQDQFLAEWPESGQSIDLSDVTSIVTSLKWAFKNRNELLKKRQATWKLAKRELNWEHESKSLLTLVEEVLKT